MNFDAYMNPTDFEHLPCDLSTDDLIALAQSEKYATLISDALVDRLQTTLETLDGLDVAYRALRREVSLQRA